MSKTATDWRLMARQLKGTCRLDLRRALLSPRSLGLYFLAFAPVLLVAIWSLTPLPTEELAGPQETAKVFAVLFEFYIRVSIFFSAMFLFVSLYRSEILERSLHYYLLTPVRREVVALGKYLAALTASAGVFVVGTTVLFLIVASPWGMTELGNYMFSGPGLTNLLAYIGICCLACAGYGALFLLVGILFRNPVIPAAVIWGWEAANLLLPPALKQFSVIYHLHSLYPVPLARGVLEVVGSPAPAWVAMTGAVGFTVLVLYLAGRKVKTMDLAYGGE
jgi:hypothetical protein